MNSDLVTYNDVLDITVHLVQMKALVTDSVINGARVIATTEYTLIHHRCFVISAARDDEHLAISGDMMAFAAWVMLLPFELKPDHLIPEEWEEAIRFPTGFLALRPTTITSWHFPAPHFDQVYRDGALNRAVSWLLGDDRFAHGRDYLWADDMTWLALTSDCADLLWSN
ncbi:hypothetical protein GS397_10470 [Sphingobium yanoikuyae]|uniref:Uncharacterized protein n=1 Tax=Sphingobium yanoikuyae TaxID=13690 RepID=A0A6P1GG22_SPHYA|nr:hypothetical protein [Sphingobium yanoikuyae]QHD67435.1 hypothetical protein GS397_10470 [Sphingobium yanoikuyae]RSU74027.1 hypothetical protein BRX37_14020 [Sphingomonas sp. S-NIH.Pt3_0716]